jgi:two-component system sensor histidine kinase KdpD
VDRPDAQSLLAELGLEPKLTVYLGGAPGAGKTHRILMEALAQQQAGRRVAIGWVETKERPNLEELASRLPRIAPRLFGGQEDFDLGAALASDYETFVLDELAHTNPDGAPSAKRWLDALALRAADRSVLGAFNVQHLENVAPVAERIIGRPITEIVPISFLRAADSVIALDVSPSILESRLRAGRIVRPEDVDRAANGLFRPQNLALLRELLLRTVDDLTVPVIAPARVSNALALVTAGFEPMEYLRRVAAFADALDLTLEATSLGKIDEGAFADAALAVDATRIASPAGLERGRLDAVHASLVAVPAVVDEVERFLQRPLDRDLYVADPTRIVQHRGLDDARHPYGNALRDRQKIGYGKLTIYLGSVAGSGKTYAMLDRANQLREEGIDVVGALIETHGRAETAAKIEGLESIARLSNGELDTATLLARRPNVALIDELAHSNTTGSAFAKRYNDVLSIVRGGISVMTTLNIQHLAGLGDAVERLTGTRVRETVPDTILEVADEVVFIDVAPDVLRQRLREGKIYPAERIEPALKNFFRLENLKALRELAVRELVHARSERRRLRPFDRIVLGVAARERDVVLVERVGRIADRLGAELRVVHVARDSEAPSVALEVLAKATRAARGAFLTDRADDAAVRLAAIATADDAIIVESPRRTKGPFSRRSFAMRVWRAGAREIIVLAPQRKGDPSSPP